MSKNLERKIFFFFVFRIWAVVVVIKEMGTV